MRRFSILLLLAACNNGSGDDNAPIDAPKHLVDAAGSGATTCGSPVPTTAGATLTLSGELEDSDGTGNGVENATVTAYGGGMAQGNALSEMSGLYQVTATTGGVPVDYFTISGTGRRTERAYPAGPIDHSTTVGNLTLFATADLTTYIGMFTGVTQDPAKGMAIVTVSDCFDATRASGVVTVTPPGTSIVKYLHSDNSTDGTSTDDTGIAVVFNITGTVTIGAAVSGTPYHEYAIAADPSYLVLATIAER
jgi:hypothetical protein